MLSTKSFFLVVLSISIFTAIAHASDAPLAPSPYGYLKDFLLVPHHQKQVRFRPVIKFWSNSNQDYLAQTAHKAMGQAFEKVLGLEGKLLTNLKKSVEEALLKEFVLGLQVLKITNSKMQVDLYFLPELDDPSSYGVELSSNQLVNFNFDDQASLSGTVQKLNEPLEFYESMKRYSDFLGSLASSNLGNLGAPAETYGYLGGALSFELNILDLNVDLTSPVPNPKKNAVKGIVRIRRYFKLQKPVLTLANEERTNTIMDGSSRINLDEVVYEPIQREGSFVTVDQVKTFNLANFKPEPKYLEIHFGSILDAYDNDRSIKSKSRHEGTGSWLSRVPFIGHLGSLDRYPVISPKLGNPVISGQVDRKYCLDYKLHFSVQRLVFDFKTQEFDPWKSSVYPNQALGSHAVLKNAASYLVKKFELARFLQ